MSTHSRIGAFFLQGQAGKLESILNIGSSDATHACVVCHPHPLFGGTLHNKVVFHTMKALNRFGFPVLRFNFRGAGLSEGQHDFGQGEQEDVQVALDWLRAEFHLPIIFSGFSFGAATGMRVACPADSVRALISVGTPFSAEGRLYSYDFLQHCDKPKLLVSGGADQYASPSELHALASRTPSATLKIVKDADHFFFGKLDDLRTAIETWILDNGLGVRPA